MPLPTIPLGETGVQVTRFGLGGEGVLRSWNREREATALIQRALELGVTYFESARAYSGSESYLGAALGAEREKIFLTSKSAERTRAGALRDLETTLRNFRTEYVDLWQVHDLREEAEWEALKAPGGALEAFEEARSAGKVRFIGITGHHHPGVSVPDGPDAGQHRGSPSAGVSGRHAARGPGAADGGDRDEGDGRRDVHPSRPAGLADAALGAFHGGDRVDGWLRQPGGTGREPARRSVGTA
jgi:hypothetical protein